MYYIHRLKLRVVSTAFNILLEAKFAVGMEIPMRIRLPMGMGKEWDSDFHMGSPRKSCGNGKGMGI